MMSGQLRTVAVVVAVGAIVFVVYRHQHHSPVMAIGGPVAVLVAKRPIQKGTTGNLIRATGRYYKVANFALSQVKAGAITDTSMLTGAVAVKDIVAGQQLTAADFDQLGRRRVLFPKNGLDRPQG
jgi:flagella basal body P-ring formation protein FlgA